MENTGLSQSGANQFRVGPNDYTQRVLAVSLTLVVAGKVFLGGSKGSLMLSTAHNMAEFDVIRVTSGKHIAREFGVTKADNANDFNISHSFKDGEAPLVGETFSHYRAITQVLDSNGTVQFVEGQTKVVDNLDIPSYVPSSGGDGIIPRSSVDAIIMVASLVSSVTRIQNVGDVGEFMNVYLDAARTQFIGHLPLTPDEILDVDVAAGKAIYIGAAKNVDIDDADSILQLNFIGQV